MYGTLEFSHDRSFELTNFKLVCFSLKFGSRVILNLNIDDKIYIQAHQLSESKD